MAWITADGYMQERIVDPHTGLKKVVSVKVSGTSERAKQDAYRRLQERIETMGDPHVRLTAAIDTYFKENERDLKPSSIRKMTIELSQSIQDVLDVGVS